MTLGLEKGIIRLEPYNPDWERFYKEEEKLLIDTVGEHILDIQHIGSTSIHGMIAKPIIDIGMAITIFEEGFELIEPIKKIGYEYKGENNIPRRHYFIKGDPTTHHLHILELYSKEWKKHIIFRDSLRKNKDLANVYAQIKVELAEKFRNDRLAYTEGKTDFVNYILENNL